MIGNSDKPLPEGEERVLEEGRKTSLDHLRPKGWWDYGTCAACGDLWRLGDTSNLWDRWGMWALWALGNMWDLWDMKELWDL